MSIHEIDVGSACNATLQIALFQSVRNSKELRKLVMNGQIKCCLIKPSIILDPFQVAVAACKALLSEKDETMTTRNVFTEILYNLSNSKNISQSLSKFGISDDDENVLVVVIQRGKEVSPENVFQRVEGELLSIKQLETIRDIPSIMKVYGVRDEELKISSLLDSVVSRIAAKECVSFK
ncbi:EKC/KEOPS complex subunit TPRKB-like [Ischnura elegans]|uniref:EKC/KEOPS complex subunit TPRKB-like n=1 Tax=Ischnura elegans TaxID=197161 RepID=UPI001ED8B44E|nr:EKC/KEOPS complex subunit TPRKB-like [Ischnura elegans]